MVLDLTRPPTVARKTASRLDLTRPTVGSISKDLDLATSQGLYELARAQGGQIAQEAEEIMNPQMTFLGKVADYGKTALSKTIKVLNLGANVVAGLIDPEKTVREAIDEEIMPADVLYSGVEPETKLGKAGVGVAKFLTNVLLDPVTYLTFGVGTGTKIGTQTLTKTGQTYLQKLVKEGLESGLNPEFAKEVIENMIKESPELAKVWIDKGGIKFFGKTLLSSQRIGTSVGAIPGMKKVDEATKPIRNLVGSLFSKDIDPVYGKLPDEFIEGRNAFADLGFVRSEDVVKRAIDIAHQNKLTIQEANFITNALDKGLPLADDRLQNVANLYGEIFKVSAKREAERGILKSILPNYVPHQMVDETTKFLPFIPGKTTSALKYAGHRKLSGTIKEINEALGVGFDENIVRLVAKRAVASERAITAHDFFEWVIKKYGSLADNAPTGFVKSGVKELEKYAFHPAIANQLGKFNGALGTDKAMNQLLKSFDELQNIWKASVTSVFPAFHGRNAISNVFQNFLDLGLDALNPARHGAATELLNMNNDVERLTKLTYGTGVAADKAKIKLAEILNKKVFTDSFNNTWTFGELRSLIRNNRVAFGTEFVGLMDIGEAATEGLSKAVLTKGEKAGELVKKALPISKEFVGYKAGRNVGRFIEEEARLVNFLGNLKKTGDPLLAATRAKQFLFDYQNLSPFEKSFMKRIVPFYTFTRKNLELQARALATVPGRVATEVKALQTVGDILSGGQEITEDDKKRLPDWIKQGIGILANKKGETLTILGSFQTPLEQPFQALQPNQIMGSISPFIRVPIEQATGYNFFYGKALSEVDNAAGFKNAPEAVKKFIGFQEVNGTRADGTPYTWYVSLNPERMNLLLNLPPTSRVLSTLKQISNQDLSEGYRLLQFLAGVRPYSFDLEREERLKEKNYRTKLEDLLQKAGVVYKFQRVGEIK